MSGWMWYGGGMNNQRLAAGVVSLLLLLAACTPGIEKHYPPESAKPDNFPADLYTAARAHGQPVYRIDSTGSLVTIHVYPDGKLARHGHEHIVASHDIQGFLLWPGDWTQRRADIYMPLETLTVDEPELRREYGLKKQPGEKDIQGTRNNMLNKTLQLGKNHFVSVHIAQTGNSSSSTPVEAIFTLNAVSVHRTIDTKVEAGEGRLIFSGDFSISQSEFGLRPFSVLGGLLQVKDKIDIYFRIAARPAE